MSIPKCLTVLLVSSLLLTACGREETALNTVNRPPAPAPTTTAAPTTTTIPTITRDTRLTLDGLGPVTIGSTRAQVEAASDLKISKEFAGGIGEGADECLYGDVSGGPLGVSVMTIGGKISRVEISDNSAIQTQSGLKIGDNIATVTRLYPTAVREPHYYIPGGFTFTLKSVSSPPNRALVIEVDDRGRVEQFRSGLLPDVLWVEGCA